MDNENHEIEKRESGNSSKEKYIHVNDIKTEKLDDDEDYKKSEHGKLPKKNIELEEKTKKDQSQGDETVGIP